VRLKKVLDVNIFEDPVELNERHVVHLLSAVRHSFGAQTKHPVETSNTGLCLLDILESIFSDTSAPLWFFPFNVQLGHINLSDALVVLNWLASWVCSLLVQELLLHQVSKIGFFVVIHL